MPDDSRTSRDDIRPEATQRNPEGGLSDLIHSDRAIAKPVAGTLKFEGDDTEEGDLDIEQGTDVLCMGGEKIGEVLDITGNHLVVERGFFIPKDVYIPKDIISVHHDETGVRLILTKKQFEGQDWSEEPDGDG